MKTKFDQYGHCELEITATKVSEKAKEWLDDPVLFFIRIERQLPDMVGHFKPDPSKKLPYGFYEGLIVVEVKNEEPTVQ